MLFPFHVFTKHGVGRKHNQVISVDAEGLKGMWAVAQGCFVGTELRVQVEEVEILVAYSFVSGIFSSLYQMPARL